MSLPPGALRSRFEVPRQRRTYVCTPRSSTRAAGAIAVAEQELQAAIKLQPSLEGSAEVKQLRARLQQLANKPR